MNYGVFSMVDKKEVTTAELTLTEELGTEEAYYDMLSIESGINDDIKAMHQAEDLVVSMNNSIILNKDIENNKDLLKLAMESLNTTTLMLGGSNISNVDNTTMEIAIEEEKNFISKLIDSIKAIFKKIINSAKKLFVKMLVAVDGTVNTAIKLKKYVNKNVNDGKLTKPMFDVEDSKRLNIHTFIKDTLDSLKITVKGGDVITTVDKVLKLNEETEDAVSKLEATYDGADLEQKITEEYVKQAKISAEYFSKLSPMNPSDAEKYFGFNIPDSYNNIVTLYVTSYNIEKLRVAYVYNTKDDDDDDVILTHIAIATLNKDKSMVIEKAVSVKSKSEIIKMLDNIIVMGKALPKLEKETSKIINNANKALDKIAKKAAGGSKLSYAINKLKAGNLTKLRDMTVSTILNNVIDEFKLMKGELYTVRRHISMYGSNEM